MANNKDRVLVYSDDPKDQMKMSGQADKLQAEQIQKDLIAQNNYTIIFRIEKNGRGGKIVTVLDKWPAYEPFLKELTKELKVKCGVGGSFSVNNEFGSIEIQGDKRDTLKKILDTKKIKYKGV